MLSLKKSLLLLLLLLPSCTRTAQNFIDEAAEAGGDVYAPTEMQAARAAEARGDVDEGVRQARNAKQKASMLKHVVKDFAAQDLQRIADRKQDEEADAVALPDGVSVVTGLEAVPLIEKGALLLDVRTVPEPVVKVAMPAPRAVLREARYPQGVTLLLMGTRLECTIAAKLLVERGYTRVIVVEGDVPQRGANNGPAPLTPDELADSKSVVVVDARAEGLFAAAHIPSAKNIPEPTLAAAAGSLERSVVVVVGIDGADSQRAALALHNAGHPSVRWLQGGFVAWASAGKRIETGKKVTQ